ncbi:hypothetical protein E2C01_045678 [Portunus trituberculatus]|uniref:Uncharacterized protein n=1 Tax=Portunus trituberculatus TaxID=210409 RepID=A0A5B7G5P0_PORTR|nr:hypothetical protein [Portunus trituberculatus]
MAGPLLPRPLPRWLSRLQRRLLGRVQLSYLSLPCRPPPSAPLQCMDKHAGKSRGPLRHKESSGYKNLDIIPHVIPPRHKTTRTLMVFISK